MLCKLSNCSTKVYAKKLCRRHYEQMRTKGFTTDLPKNERKIQKFIKKGNTYLIELCGRDGKVLKYAVIDEQDYNLVKKYKCNITGGKYVRCYCKGEETKLLHQIILGHSWVDHKDLDGFNCRRFNLRPCTPQQNQFNKRSYKNSSFLFKGVHRVKRKKGYRFIAQIRVNKKNIHLGIFDSEVKAHEEYSKYANIYHKEFANKSVSVSIN